jgi:hypothetical protein
MAFLRLLAIRLSMLKMAHEIPVYTSVLYIRVCCWVGNHYLYASLVLSSFHRNHPSHPKLLLLLKAKDISSFRRMHSTYVLHLWKFVVRCLGQEF